jgi:hypothetical protein
MWYVVAAGAVLAFVGVVIAEYRRLQRTSSSPSASSFPISGAAGSRADAGSPQGARVVADGELDREEAGRVETLLEAPSP